MASVHRVLLISVFIFLLFADTFIVDANTPPLYSYKRYNYKKKQKNEKKIRHVKSSCEAQCGSDYNLKEVECTRKCMSERCYNDIYAPDPLEEGEIDVRYASFKGCVLLARK